MTKKNSETPAYKRKRLFVDPKVQGSLLRQLILHWCMACFLIFIYLFTLQAFSNGFSLGFSENMSALWNQYGLLALVLGVLSPVFIYDSIKMSNRFVGPMVSFRAALKDLANGGEPSPVKFRESDFWQDMTGDLNKVAATVKELRANQGDNSQPPEDAQPEDAQPETVEAI